MRRTIARLLATSISVVILTAQAPAFAYGDTGFSGVTSFGDSLQDAGGPTDDPIDELDIPDGGPGYANPCGFAHDQYRFCMND